MALELGVVRVRGIEDRMTPERVENSDLVGSGAGLLTTGLDPPKRGPNVRQNGVRLLDRKRSSYHA